MSKFGFGEKHPRWKGGRVLTSSGYMAIIVPKGHHLRMNNGYAYEHKIVAETKIGRRLLSGEIVHHINGDKTDNRPENIEVCPSRFSHKVKHRKSVFTLRKPNEPNILVKCACGCGTEFYKYDKYGRLRIYAIGGHWRKGKKGGWVKNGNEQAEG
jgi:hypothetical protein